MSVVFIPRDYRHSRRAVHCVQPAGAPFGAAAQPEGVVSPLLMVTPVRRVNV
jgi:hypothetical protein